MISALTFTERYSLFALRKISLQLKQNGMERSKCRSNAPRRWPWPSRK